jgi:hypothetical protein
VRRHPARVIGAAGVQLTGASPLGCIRPRGRLPDPVRLHVDLVLDLAGEVLALDGEDALQVAAEEVEALELGVR